MEETTQFNIRLPESLIRDMEYIAQHLKMSRNDWLKYKISELIKNEKIKIMEIIERNFVYGRIDNEEFEKKMGYRPNPQLISLKKKVSEAPQRYFQDILKGIDGK